MGKFVKNWEISYPYVETWRNETKRGDLPVGRGELAGLSYTLN